LIYKGRQLLDIKGQAEEGRVHYHNGLDLAIESFKAIESMARDDLKGLMLSEYTFLTQELQLCVTGDDSAKVSLTKALADFDDAFFALEIVNNPADYKKAAQTYSRHPEFRYHDRPKDAFHVACAGHKARVANVLKSPGINMLEKELLKQRRSNMTAAQIAYLEKQKQAANYQN
jgi:hypothetical protein